MKSTYFALLRHGHAENNSAEEQHKVHKNPRAYDEVIKVPSSMHDLTPIGREQAIQTGVWLREHDIAFDHHVVSGYVRAMRTAQLLNIADARWEIDERLCEKDSGVLNTLTPSKLERHFGERGNSRHLQDPYRYRPSDGESFLDLDVRIRSLVEQLQTGTLVVCHGHVMRIIDRVIMRGESAWEFGTFKPPRGDVPNGAFIEYFRKDVTDRWQRRMSVPCRGAAPGEWILMYKYLHSNEALEALVERILDVAKASTAA